MILNNIDATWAMNYFIEYFGQYERIDQYLKEQKLEQETTTTKKENKTYICERSTNFIHSVLPDD